MSLPSKEISFPKLEILAPNIKSFMGVLYCTPISIATVCPDECQIRCLTFLMPAPRDSWSVRLFPTLIPIDKSWALNFSPVPVGFSTVLTISSGVVSMVSDNEKTPTRGHKNPKDP